MSNIELQRKKNAQHKTKQDYRTKLWFGREEHGIRKSYIFEFCIFSCCIIILLRALFLIGDLVGRRSGLYQRLLDCMLSLTEISIPGYGNNIPQ